MIFNDDSMWNWYCSSHDLPPYYLCSNIQFAWTSICRLKFWKLGIYSFLMNTQVARKMPIKSKNRLKNNIDLKKKKKINAMIIQSTFEIIWVTLHLLLFPRNISSCCDQNQSILTQSCPMVISSSKILQYICLRMVIGYQRSEVKTF